MKMLSSSFNEMKLLGLLFIFSFPSDLEIQVSAPDILLLFLFLVALKEFDLEFTVLPKCTFLIQNKCTKDIELINKIK